MCSLFVRRLRSRRCCSASFPSTAGCCSAPCSGCSSVAAAVVQRRLWLGSRAVTHGARVLSGAGCVISVRLCSARDGSSTARTPPPPAYASPYRPPYCSSTERRIHSFPTSMQAPKLGGGTRCAVPVQRRRPVFHPKTEPSTEQRRRHGRARRRPASVSRGEPALLPVSPPPATPPTPCPTSGAWGRSPAPAPARAASACESETSHATWQNQHA